MSKNPLFKMKTEHRSTQWNPSFDLDFVQCPVCKRWATIPSKQVQEP